MDKNNPASNFPLLIRLVLSGKTMVAMAPSDIPCGVTFQVVKTRYTGA
jgi:hypothetical protein